MSNLTKPTSINRIYNELKSQGVSIGKNTLYDVIVQTESVYLFFSLTKYEPSLVKESTGDKKYYCIDNGLRSVLLNPHSEDNESFWRMRSFFICDGICESKRSCIIIRGRKSVIL